MKKEEFIKHVDESLFNAATYLGKENRFPSIIICESIDLSKSDENLIQGTGIFTILSKSELKTKERIAILKGLIQDEKENLKKLN